MPEILWLSAAGRKLPGALRCGLGRAYDRKAATGRPPVERFFELSLAMPVSASPDGYFENRYGHNEGACRLLAWKSMTADGLMVATARAEDRDLRRR